MIKRGRIYDEKYLILRFDIYGSRRKIKDKTKKMVIMQRNIDEFGDFQIKLVDKFCSESFQVIIKKYFFGKEKYKKPSITGIFDIGMDLLSEEIGLLLERHWSYLYFKVPKDNIELVRFFEEQDFSFEVKRVKTI
jgi:hypothetical protein